MMYLCLSLFIVSYVALFQFFAKCSFYCMMLFCGSGDVSSYMF